MKAPELLHHPAKGAQLSVTTAASQPFPYRVFAHGVIPDRATLGSGNQLFKDRQGHPPCGLATMESDNGILCWTGRVVEADIDLRGEPDRIGRARGRGRFRS